jgi:hypothetical protein
MLSKLDPSTPRGLAADIVHGCSRQACNISLACVQSIYPFFFKKRRGKAETPPRRKNEICNLGCTTKGWTQLTMDYFLYA